MPHNFITNARARTLKRRIEQLIAHSQELKFLVGFFYFSGWREIYHALQARTDLSLNILVGLDVDRTLDGVLEVPRPGDSLSNDELADRFLASLGIALNDEALDTAEFYKQVSFFLALLENGRLQIKKTIEPNHAKLYLFCLDETGREIANVPGRFITGSSNLTRAGLLGQQEFNVEIGDYGWGDAEKYFNDLWGPAVPITEVPQRREALIRLVRDRTQVAEITPYEAYALVIKTYLDLMEQKQIKPHVIRLLEENGYIPYRYQLDAVNQALTIIEQYNGVIVADVVGLGKSVIASLIARQLGKRGLVLCPPGLMGDRRTKSSGWHKYLEDFQLYGWEVYSTGDLEKVVDYLDDYGDDIEVIIVDEAHRFRNQDTESYELLSAICRNRQVILLTATPVNNAPSDIFALLKLFIIPGKSRITLDEDLEGRFGRYQADFRRLAYISRYHDAGGEKQKRAEKYYAEMFDTPLPIDLRRVQRRARQLAAEIRAVLMPVLIRRNRLDLRNDPVYSQEVTQLSDVADPIELFYELTPEQSRFYDQVVNDYFGEDGRFRGAIYQPYAYEAGFPQGESALDEEGNRAFQQQRNLYNFMRRLLVKRFESSFGAFAQSIQNFIHVHERVLEFIEASGGRYILDRQLIEKIYQEDPEEIDAALEAFAERLAQKVERPRHERIYNVYKFDLADQFIADIQTDLQLLRDIHTQVEMLDLVANDPKATRLLQEIRRILAVPANAHEPRRKVVVFSEYVDTIAYLRPIVESAFPGKILSVVGNLPASLAGRILLNFDASIPLEQQDDGCQILLTSDKLSEGVNLNRAGDIINYDIPWNPTRVIQRVGRINRIGKKVFNQLYTYNFFPTEKGADIIQSREIAANKMFLIHNTLGEDAKIFDVDEQPVPSALFTRINRNPEEEDEESTLTMIRQRFTRLEQEHPEVAERVAQFPVRVKTAKTFSENQLLVFRRKGLGFFVQGVLDTGTDSLKVEPFLLEDALPLIECPLDEPRLPLSQRFWPAYEMVKKHREGMRNPKSDASLETKALNNLRSAQRHYIVELAADLPFIRTLIEDLREYKTLPTWTLRRLFRISLAPNMPEELSGFQREIAVVRRRLGEDYLEIVKKRLGQMRSEIIIAIENQSAGRHSTEEIER